MEKIVNKYKRGLLFLLILSTAFSISSLAQSTKHDSVVAGNVNIAYGSQPKWMVNSAISVIGEDKLLQSFTTNLGNMMFGRLPGFTVMPTGNEPGNDGSTLYVRGINTFGTGKQVLVIVDGTEGAYEDLTPYEIESVTVLKDASATALYGSRGANGVVLITTKRGFESPMIINFSMQQGFRQAQRIPEFLGSYDFANLYNEALWNEGKDTLYSPEDLEAYRSGSDPYFHPDVDWYSEVLRKTSPLSNYNLNFKGGNAGVRYFVLLNLLRDNGLYIRTADMSEYNDNQKYSRFNVRTNIDVKLGKITTATLLVGASREVKDNPKANNTNTMFDLLSSVPPNNFPIYNPNNTFGGSSTYSNPVGDMLMTGFYQTISNYLHTTLKFTEDLDMVVKGLSATASVSFNNFSSVFSNKSRTYARYSISKVGEDTLYNKIGEETSLGSSTDAKNQWRNLAFQLFVNYNRSIGNNEIDALLMYQEYSKDVVGTAEPYRYSGLSGRFTYANRGKYIADLAFAYNGSIEFPKGSRWGLFPALSLGWIVSNEGFLTGNNTLNYLKIRGSYGLTGNDQIGGTRFMFNEQPYSYIGNIFLGAGNTGFQSIAEGKLRNGNVTWEKEKKLNIGFEAKMFRKLDIEFDIFWNNRYDILATPSRETPAFIGLGTLPDYNVGENENKGFEAGAAFSTDQSRDVQFHVSATAWYARNKIVYNAEAFQQDEYLYTTGHPVNQPFRLEAIGFFSDLDDINNSPFQTFSPVIPGDIKYKNQNDDNNDATPEVIDQNDYYPVGKPGYPEFTAGLETGLKVKSFDISFFFQGVTGRSVYLPADYYQAFQNNGKVTSVALGRWTPETSETATYPRLSASNNLNNQHSSTFWQRDGSFIKLRSAEIGYNFTESALQKIHLDNARVYINGTNLFSLDHMDFTDPETQTGYPAIRTYSIGVRFQF